MGRSALGALALLALVVVAASAPAAGVTCYDDRELQSLADKLSRKASSMHKFGATTRCMKRRLVRAKKGQSQLCLPDEGLSALLIVCAMETHDFSRSSIHPSMRTVIHAAVPDTTLWRPVVRAKRVAHANERRPTVRTASRPVPQPVAAPGSDLTPTVRSRRRRSYVRKKNSRRRRRRRRRRLSSRHPSRRPTTLTSAPAPIGEPDHYRGRVFAKIVHCGRKFPCCIFSGSFPTKERTCFSQWCQRHDGC